MTSTSQTPGQNTPRRIQQIQAITIVWMSAKAGVSLFAAWTARSPALLAFGGDSGIELLSATFVLCSFALTLYKVTQKEVHRGSRALYFVRWSHTSPWFQQ